MLRCIRLTKILLGALLVATASPAQAVEIPSSIKTFLLVKKNRPDLVSRFEAIPVLSPQAFVQRFLGVGGVGPLGAGYSGVVFKNAQRRAAKFNFRILAAFNRVRLDANAPEIRPITPIEADRLREGWVGLFTDAAVDGVDIPALRKDDGPVGSQPTAEDLLGTLVWAAYNPSPTAFPSMVSDDGLAYETDLVDGVTFKEILESERQDTLLHRKFNIKEIWQRVVELQHISEEMLFDSGVTIDLFTPGNLMVGGTYDKPIVRPLDNALAKPSPEAYRYYESIGHHVPSPDFEGALRIIEWPTMPEHIVSSRLWGLNIAQAAEFVQAYFHLSTKAEAVARMARIGEWKIVEAPFLADFSNVRKARLLVTMQRCGRLLGGQ